MKVLSVEDLQKELQEIYSAEREALDTLNRVIGAKMICEKLLRDLSEPSTVATPVA